MRARYKLQTCYQFNFALTMEYEILRQSHILGPTLADITYFEWPRVGFKQWGQAGHRMYRRK